MGGRECFARQTIYFVSMHVWIGSDLAKVAAFKSEMGLAHSAIFQLVTFLLQTSAKVRFCFVIFGVNFAYALFLKSNIMM